MKRKLLLLLALILTLALCLSLAACGDDEKEISSVKYVKGSIATEYNIGDTPDFSKIQVLITYSDNSTKTVGASDLEIGTVDTSTAGEKTLTVKYGDFTVEVNITVNTPAASLTGIQILSGSAEATAKLGAVYSTANLQVEALYSDGSKKPIDRNDLEITLPDTTSVGEKKLTVKYQGYETSLTVTVTGVTSMTVVANTIDSEIYIGTSLNTSNLKVLVTYSNGETKTVEAVNLTIGAIDSSTAGEKKLTIAYEGFTYQYTLNVYGPTSIKLNSGTFDTKVLVGGKLNLSGISAQVSFSNGTAKTVHLSDLEITDISTAAAGKQKLTVKYGTAETEAEITVVGVKEMTVIGVKNEILAGETLDTSSISLSVKYTDDTTEVVTKGITTSTVNSSTAGDKKLSVTYLDKTIEYNVKVLGINSLALYGVPASVNVGEAHDLSHMTAELIYSATKKVSVNISDLTITNININLPGKQIFKAVYTDAILGDITATVEVLVIGVSEISITDYPLYTKAGHDVDTSLVKFKVTYTDGTSKSGLTSAAATVTADKNTGVITVTYTEKGITKTAAKTSAITVPLGIKVTGVPVKYKSDSDATLSDVAPDMKVYLYYPQASGLTDDLVTAGYTTNFDAIKEEFKNEDAEITLTVNYNAFSENVTISTTAPALESIEITDFKAYVLIKKTYDNTSIKVTATYANGRTDIITYDKLTSISNIITTSAGKQTLTVGYGGKTAEKEIDVLPVTQILVEGLASVVDINKDLDTTELAVTVVYGDNVETELITAGNYTMDGFNKAAAGNQTITFKVPALTTTVTGTHSIHVKAVESIEVVSGTHASYIKAGGEIDLSTLKIKVTYTNGDFEQISSGFTKSANNTEGTISVSYTENGITKEDTSAFEVLQITEMIASGIPDKIDIGNDIDLTKISVTVIYGNNIESEVVTTGITIEDFNKAVSGVQTIKVKISALNQTVYANHTICVRKITDIAIKNGTYPLFVREGIDYDTSKIEIDVVYSNGDTDSGLPSKFGASILSNQNPGNLTISFKASLGELISDTVNITTVYKVVSVDALNGTIPSVLFDGEALPLNKIALTVYYNENGNTVPHLIYLTNENLVLKASGDDYNEQYGTWASSGEKMVTLVFMPEVLNEYGESEWTAIARVVIRGVESVELVPGSINTSVPVGKTLETEDAQFKVIYTDGSYTYILANDIDVKFNFDGFSTEAAGTTSFKVTYKLNDGETDADVIAKHTVTVTVAVVEVVDGDSSIIFGVELPKNITARDSYKTNFKENSNVYVVGDDNKFFFRLTLLTLGPDGVPTNTTSYTSISQVYLLDAGNLSGEGTQVGTEYVVIDESDNSFDFTEAAIGKYFRIVSAPEAAQSNKKSLVVRVVDAYNAYDVKELNLITNYEEDLDGSEFANVKDEHGNEYGQLTAVKKFLAKHNIEYVNVSGVVLHSNMNVTESDIPEEYFFEYEKDGIRKKGLFEYLSVYNRNLTTPGESFTLYGNYYSIYSYNLPCVVEKGVANNEDEFSSAQLIYIRGRNENAIKADTVNKHRIYKGSILDTGFRDNDPNSNDQSASARHMLGLIGIKLRKCDALIRNINIEAYYISLFADWDNLDMTIENSKIYNAWQGHLFIYNENDMQSKDEMPGEYYQNVRVNIKNSLMGKCGGPVILSQQNEAGYNKNLHSGATVNIDEASELYSYVTGQEAWFVAVGATADASNVMLLDNPIRNNSNGLSSITSKDKIQGVETMNLIMLSMQSGVSTSGSYEVLNDSLSIGTNKVLDLSATGTAPNPLTQQGMTLKNNYEVDVMLNGGATTEHPIFQTSTILPTADILGVNIKPTFVADPYSNTIVNTFGETIANTIRGQVAPLPDGTPQKDQMLEQANAIENAWQTGDYISLYFGGLALTLEYYHTAPAN